MIRPTIQRRIQTLYYTIYKVTNKANEKYYIGKHQTKNLDDGYMGSGNLVKRAIKKHGIDNFTKEILYIFQTEEEMDAMEKELVVLSEMSYNMCEGGKGGFGYVNKKGINNKNHEHVGKLVGSIIKGRKNPGASVNLKKLHADGKIKIPDWTGRKHSDKSKNLMSEKKTGIIPWNKGKVGAHSEETKRKISEKLKGRAPWNKGKKENQPK
jgi:hypothetical protein